MPDRLPPARRKRPVASLRSSWMLLLLSTLLVSCTDNPLQPYVPVRCHGAAAPFETFTLEYQNVPGFIVSDIDQSLRGALFRQGLSESAVAESADVRMVAELALIDHNPLPLGAETDRPDDGTEDYPMGQPLRDPFDQGMGSASLNRFVTHLSINMIDQRTGDLIWVGSIDRAHAISGSENFHSERAILQISNAFDDMFVGLTTPCG